MAGMAVVSVLKDTFPSQFWLHMCVGRVFGEGEHG